MYLAAIKKMTNSRGLWSTLCSKVLQSKAVDEIAVPTHSINNLQVLKTFSKNVEGCRSGSAKNHMNYMYGSKTDHRKTTQVTPSLHLFFQRGHPSKLCYEITALYSKRM